MAQDETSGEIVGGVIVRRSKYCRGKLTFAVGLDTAQRITNVVLISINKNYLIEFKTDVNKEGFPDYAGMSIGEIVSARALSYTSKHLLLPCVKLQYYWRH